MLSKRITTALAAFVAATVASLTLAAPAQAAGVHYVALGDSYSSGVGAGSYISSSGDCKRSSKAYPQLWANANSPASYTSVACSGATTTTVINSQLSALKSTTTLVTITIGGNDVGFANIMTTCVLQGQTQCVASVDAAMASARSSLASKLGKVYSGIRSKAPNAKVIVLSYPVFYQLGVTCVGLSATSRAKINSGINLVDDITRTTAQQYGFTFADVRSIFVGHQLCSGDKWIHALNFADIGISYHPFAAGHSGGYYPVMRAAV